MQWKKKSEKLEGRVGGTYHNNTARLALRISYVVATGKMDFTMKLE